MPNVHFSERLWQSSSEETTDDCLNASYWFIPSASLASFFGQDWRHSSNWQCSWHSLTSWGLPNVNPATCARSWLETFPVVLVLVPTRPPSNCHRRSARSSRWWSHLHEMTAHPRCRPRNRTELDSVEDRSRWTMLATREKVVEWESGKYHN